MAVKFTSLSDLNVIPTGAGAVANSTSESTSPPSPDTGTLESKIGSRSSSTLGSSLTPTTVSPSSPASAGNRGSSLGLPSSNAKFVTAPGIVSGPSSAPSPGTPGTNFGVSVDTAKSTSTPGNIFAKASANGASSGIFGASTNDFSNLVRESTVFSYSESVYDTELTASGLTSAYPVIFGIAPLQNLYSSGKESNYGVVYDIQGSLKDTTISQSNAIVDSFYKSNPAASASLASLRDANLSKFNYMVTNLPYLLEYRENIINATKISSYLSSERSTIDQKIAIAQKGLGNLEFYQASPIIANTVTTLGGFVPSSDNEISLDDISAYGSSDKPLTDVFSQRLLGDYDGTADNISSQASTTRQYQLLRAAVAQVSQGIRFDPESLENSSATSPYYDMEFDKIASINRFLAENGTLGSGFPFAKSALSVIGDVIANDYTLTDSSLNSSDDIQSFLDNYNLVYAGNLAKDSDGKIFVPTKSNKGTAILSTDTQLYSAKLQDPSDSDSYSENLPYIGIREDVLTLDFISQFAVELSYEIMEKTKPTSYDPASVNPMGGTIKVSDTASDSLRFISKSESGKNIFLFDGALKATVDNSEPVSAVISSQIGDLQNLKTDLSSIKQALYDFTDDKGHLFTNQCSLTILKTFYKYIRIIFSDTILNGTKTDDASAARIAILMAAATDADRAGKIFRMIDDPAGLLVRRAADGLDSDIDDAGKNCYYAFAKPDITTFTGAYEAESSPKIVNEGYSVKSDEPTVLNFNIEKSFQDLLADIFNRSGSFFEFDNIMTDIKAIYPIAVTEGSSLAKKIKFAAFTTFLYFLRKMKFEMASKIETVKPHKTDLSDDYKFSGYIKWLPADAAFIADSLEEAISITDANDLSFTQFAASTGGSPSSEQISIGSSGFFRPIRSVVKYALQTSEDVTALISFQSSVIQEQINSIDLLISKSSEISSAYGSDPEKTSQIISRYVSLESIIEILHRSDRYQTVVPGTKISSIATRSKNYRSIVGAAFRDLIPDAEDLKVCIVGIPYGHLERLRVSQTSRNYYFGISANSDDIRTDTDTAVEVDYKFAYISNSEEVRPTFAGPNCTLIPDLYDDFSSNEIVTSVRNDNISHYRLADDRLRLDVKVLGESGSDVKSIDFPSSIVQAALRSYIEEIYGLYPHFSSTKVQMRTSGFPEEFYADAALQAAGIPYETDSDKLIYSRLKSTIMMHQDFITTRMVEELEASPIFDKIFYIPVVGDSLPDVITQFYVKVST